MPVYFAYGSNMDVAQMRRRCPSARLLGCARLSDHVLSFVGYSHGWGGGVATVRPRHGSTVFGAVFYISDDDVRTLDACEGHPVVYRREQRRVTMYRDDRVIRCLVYIHNDPNRRRSPSDRYIGQIAKAHRALGLSCPIVENEQRSSLYRGDLLDLHTATEENIMIKRYTTHPGHVDACDDCAVELGLDADGLEARPIVASCEFCECESRVSVDEPSDLERSNLVFVYGSLMSGLGNHRVIERAQFVRCDKTSDRFKMLDLGAFPGIIDPTGDDATVIEGEVYRVTQSTLDALDRLEGHPTFYRRRLVDIGGDRAWVYVLQNHRARDSFVPDGCWRSHRENSRHGFRRGRVYW